MPATNEYWSTREVISSWVLRFTIRIDFFELCVHSRPLVVFQPGFCLVRRLHGVSSQQVFPIRVRRVRKQTAVGGRKNKTSRYQFPENVAGYFSTPSDGQVDDGKQSEDDADGAVDAYDGESQAESCNDDGDDNKYNHEVDSSFRYASNP